MNAIGIAEEEKRAQEELERRLAEEEAERQRIAEEKRRAEEEKRREEEAKRLTEEMVSYQSWSHEPNNFYSAIAWGVNTSKWDGVEC